MKRILTIFLLLSAFIANAQVGTAYRNGDINARDFGVVSDGVTDDAQALYNALKTALAKQRNLYIPGNVGGKTMILSYPNGNTTTNVAYDFTGFSSTPYKIRIYGDANTVISTSLDSNGTIAGMRLFRFNNGWKDCTIESIFFESTHTLTTANSQCLNFAGGNALGVKNFTVKNCRFEGWTCDYVGNGMEDPKIIGNIMNAPKGRDNAQNNSSPATFILFQCNSNGLVVNPLVQDNIANGYSGADITTTATRWLFDNFCYGQTVGGSYIHNTLKNFGIECMVNQNSTITPIDERPVVFQGNIIDETILPGAWGYNTSTQLLSNLGIYCVNYNSLIDNNTIYNFTNGISQYGQSAVSPGYAWRHWTITNNHLYAHKGSFASVYEPILVSGYSSSLITKNVVIKSNEITFEGDTLRQHAYAVTLDFVDSCILQNNIVNVINPVRNGYALNFLRLAGGTNTFLKGNNIKGTVDSMYVYTPTTSSVLNLDNGGTVSVEAFGVTANDTTDQSAKIQAAINACSGKTLQFPTGDYYAKNLTGVNRITIIGPGILKTHGSANNAGVDHLIRFTGNSEVTIRDMGFNGNASQVAGTVQAGVPLLELFGDSNVTVTNSRFFNSNQAGVRMRDCFRVHLSNLTANNIDVAMITEGGNNIVTIDNPIVYGGTSEGVTFWGRYNSAVTGNITVQNTNPTSGTATAGSTVSIANLTASGVCSRVTDMMVHVSGVYTGNLTLQTTTDGVNWVTDSSCLNYYRLQNPGYIISSDTGTWNSDIYYLPATAGFRVSANSTFTGTAAITLGPVEVDRNMSLSGGSIKNKTTSAGIEIQYAKQVSITGVSVDSCVTGVFATFNNVSSGISINGGSYTNTHQGVSGSFVNSTISGLSIINATFCGIYLGINTSNISCPTCLNFLNNNAAFNTTVSNNTIANVNSSNLGYDGIRMEAAFGCTATGNIVNDTRTFHLMNRAIVVQGPLSYGNKVTNNQTYNSVDPNNIQTAGSPINTTISDNVGTINDAGIGTKILNGYKIGSNGTSGLQMVAPGSAGALLDVVQANLKDTTSSGTVAALYVNRIGRATISATNATTYTVAAGLNVEGPPIAGTNVTFSNNPALLVNNGAAQFNGGFNTGNSTSSNLIVPGLAAAGGSSVVELQFGGSSTIGYRGAFNGITSSSLGTGYNYANLIVGRSPITTFTSGTHAWLANMVVEPLGTVTNAGASVTNTASLYVLASNNIGSGINAGVYSESGYTAALGSGLNVVEGTNGRVGQVTLVSGVKAITISGLTTSSRAFVVLVSESGAALTVKYRAVCTTNTLTISAVTSAGNNTTNTADASTINYWIIN